MKEKQNNQVITRPKLELLKREERFKMVIPANVEQKIRLACASLPDKEWSGVLFFTYKGNIEQENLVITVRDILVMDVGNATYTEWCADAEVISYMADNDLLDCQMGIVHSHNRMATFFSGTDTSTLHDEGQDRNNIVSLIVNNEGTYNAAITRLNNVVSTVHEEGSYEFFGEGTQEFSSDYEVEETYMEYYMFDIIRKEPKGLFGFINRLKSIMSKPRTVPYYGSDWDSGRSYGNYGYNTYGTVKTSGQTPTSKVSGQTTAQPVVQPVTTVKVDTTKPAVGITTSNKKTKEAGQSDHLFFDDTVADSCFADDAVLSNTLEEVAIQLVTGNIFAKVNTHFSLNSWVATTMYTTYKARFGTETGSKSEFQAWLDGIIDYLLFSMSWPIPDNFSANETSYLIAEALVSRLEAIPTKNIFLEEIIKSLKFYLD